MASDYLNRADVPREELDVDATLCSGQAFRWVRDAGGEWIGAVRDTVIRIRPERDGFLWQTYPVRDRWDVVSRYFALDVDLASLIAGWERVVPEAMGIFERWRGLRTLRQEPVEALFGFLCASCNTVTKIGRSVTALARLYGEPLAEIGGVMHYRFPGPERLAGASERMLRDALWGFRAPRVIAAATALLAKPDGWLDGLADAPYARARAELAAFEGIGPKVADCICLFGLGHTQAVPVDTHVRRIGTEMFRPDLAGKSLTPYVYAALADAFRDRFGDYAGWAQQYLFLDAMQRRSSTPHKGN
jgi:N-glycosylase/DNA lyase